MRTGRLRWLPALLLAVAVTAFPPFDALAAGDPAAPDFAFSRAAADVVARLSIRAGELRGDRARTVTVFGDGRVVVEQPPGQANAGVHEVRLSRTELDDLVGALVATGLAELDDAAVRRECEAAQSRRGEVTRVSDADEIEPGSTSC